MANNTTTRKPRKPSKADSLVEQVVAHLVDAIETGAGSWEMPWRKLAAGDQLAPTNAATGRPYSGGNRWVLALTAMLHGLDGGAWATYKQWESLGAQVRKGETAQAAVLVPMERKRTETDPATGEEVTHTWMTFTGRVVFHSSQVDGWQPQEAPAGHEPISEAENLLARWKGAGMSIEEGGDRAYYRPSTDTIHVPAAGQFVDVEHYYSTLAHEATHWTGPRLGRDLTGRFGSDAYAAEELVAELGAAVVSAGLGIDQATRDDHAAYLAGWVRILRQDPRHLWTVAGKAEQAVDHLLALGAD